MSVYFIIESTRFKRIWAFLKDSLPYEIKELSFFKIIIDSGEAYGFYSSSNVKCIECELGGVGVYSVLLI